MVWDPTLYTAVGIASACLFFVIAAAGWKHRSEPAAKAFLGLIAALGGWALIYSIQLGFTTPDAQLAWQRVALTIGGPVPTLWFLFAVQYTNREEWLTRPVRAVMILDPLIFGLLTLTNPSHGLVWSNATLVSYGSLHALDLTFGPGYYLHILYTYVVTPTGFGLLLLSVLRSTLYRTQAGLLVLGAVPPLIANTTFSLGIDWAMAAVDFTPFAFLITGPCFGLALFRFDLLERVPIARQRLIADADDGFVVLDESERIVTANPVAVRILDGASEGNSIWDHFPASEGQSLDAVEGTTLTTVVDRQQRVYDLTCSTLSDHHERIVGYILRFRDVTDRHTYEQRLKVANRVLRHDLRNRMNVITGWAEELGKHESEDVKAASRQITTTANELVELGEQVRLLVETADYGGEATESVDLGAHVTPLVAQIQDAHPKVTVETDIPAETTVLVPHAKLLTISVQNLLENAVEHNDADRPWVSVTAEPASAEDDYTRLRIADDGPGIPEAELEVLRQGNETPLKHGSGLGLWLVHWTVTAAGGTVAFEKTEPRGSVVTLAFRPGDSQGSP